jgi:hypothetical protein
MQDLFFAIGKFLEATFDMLLVPFTGILPYGGLANWIIWVIIGFGIITWLRMQIGFNRQEAKNAS